MGLTSSSLDTFCDDLASAPNNTLALVVDFDTQTQCLLSSSSSSTGKVAKSLLAAGICKPEQLVYLQNPSFEDLVDGFQSVGARACSESKNVVFYFDGDSCMDNGEFFLCLADSKFHRKHVALHTFSNLLPEDTVLVSFLARCSSGPRLFPCRPAVVRDLLEIPSSLLGMIIPTMIWDSRCESELCIAQCRPTYTLFNNYLGVELSDHTIFPETLVKYLGASGLDLHVLAAHVMRDVRLLSSSEQCPEVLTTHLKNMTSLLPEGPRHFCKVDARGLAPRHIFHEFATLVRDVKHDSEPSTKRWHDISDRLCGLPSIVQHFRSGNSEIVEKSCMEYRARLAAMPVDDERSRCIPGLLALLLRFELDAAILSSRTMAGYDIRLSGKGGLLDYHACLFSLLALHSVYLLDDLLAALVFSTLRFHHQIMMSQCRDLSTYIDHIVQAKAWGGHALQALCDLDLFDETVVCLMDAPMGSLEARILDMQFYEAGCHLFSA